MEQLIVESVNNHFSIAYTWEEIKAILDQYKGISIYNLKDQKQETLIVLFIKGQFICARGQCDCFAYCYNKETHWMYCVPCARKINQFNPGLCDLP